MTDRLTQVLLLAGLMVAVAAPVRADDDHHGPHGREMHDRDHDRDRDRDRHRPYYAPPPAPIYAPPPVVYAPPPAPAGINLIIPFNFR
jgi:hypothetical protein